MAHGSVARGPGVRFPPPLLFVAGFVAALALRRWVLPMAIGGGMPRMTGGWILVTAGLALMMTALLTFFRARTAILPHRPASRLVEHGPYRFTRNPMYVGMTALYIGGALLVNSAWPLLLLPIVIMGLVRFVIVREEAHLAHAFGEAYASYRQRVRRWL